MSDEESKPKMVKNVSVKALKKGWDNVKLRKKGEIFPYTGPLGTWMEVIPKSRKTKESQ